VIERLGDIYREARLAPAPRSSGDRPRAVDQSASAVLPEPIPTSPPPEVLDALDAAQRAMRQMDQAGVQLSFRIEHEAAGRRVRIEVRDSDGALVREIPPSKVGPLLADGSGGKLIDERG
jgi:hypothetical protein